MSIEPLSDFSENYTANDFQHMHELRPTFSEEMLVVLIELYKGSLSGNFSAPLCQGARKVASAYGHYIFGNRQIGYCLQGHKAYHKYLQENYPPILLCDTDGCLFELYKFMKIANAGN